jgi:anaerobic glycerol-3-phosphate dehydrogenase
MRLAIVRLTVLAAAVVVASGSVLSQGWSERGPVFESDVKRKAERQEAERTARRKSYGRVRYQACCAANRVLRPE